MIQQKNPKTALRSVIHLKHGFKHTLITVSHGSDAEIFQYKFFLFIIPFRYLIDTTAYVPRFMVERAFRLLSSIEKLKWEVVLFTFLHRQKRQQKNDQKRSLPAFLFAVMYIVFFVLMRKVGSPRTPQFKPYMLQRRSLQLSLYYHQEISSAKQKAIINGKIMITVFQNGVI